MNKKGMMFSSLILVLIFGFIVETYLCWNFDINCGYKESTAQWGPSRQPYVEEECNISILSSHNGIICRNKTESCKDTICWNRTASRLDYIVGNTNQRTINYFTLDIDGTVMNQTVNMYFDHARYFNVSLKAKPNVVKIIPYCYRYGKYHSGPTVTKTNVKTCEEVW